jgi:SAM-dependent methyltransferase
MQMLEDVPSPIDLRLMRDSRAWEASALEKRPWRTEFFDRLASEIASSPVPVHRVLELGSGPGFLAVHLLRALPDVAYVAFDFSRAMHQLAVERLGSLASRVEFVGRSFKDEGWSAGLGVFDCVVTHQSVHELRHKRHAVGLHAEVRRLLAPGGFYLVCDHFAGEGGMEDEALYMSVEEQQSALRQAGFTVVKLLMQKGGLALHQAT